MLCVCCRFGVGCRLSTWYLQILFVCSRDQLVSQGGKVGTVLRGVSFVSIT